MDADEDEIEQRFRELCLAVNMDKPTMELAWKAYETTKMSYSLEGDCLHWLVCALYSACRRNLPSMKSVSGQSLASNCVSLTMLLREAKFSFISFIKKMDKWLKMNRDISVGPLSDHVSALDRSFRVSTVVFKKYRLVFNYVFLDPENPKHQTSVKGSSKNPARPHRSRRHLKRHSTPLDIFNFCWTLFIHAKCTEYRAVSDELVSSFQLLLSAVDLCFRNALNCEHRTSLLNPHFPGLPEGWDQPGYETSNNTEIDIIALLVKQHAALQLSKDETESFLLQARVVNVHNWSNFVTSLLDSSNVVLVGDVLTLFQPENFDTNSKAINKVYEEYVLIEGDFDERVFLCDDVDRELGTPIKCPPVDSRADQIKREVAEHLAEPTTVTPKTPLTNRHYLEGKVDENEITTPVSTAYQAIAKLKRIVQGKKAAPSDKLSLILRESPDNLVEEISNRVDELGEIFKVEYTKQYEDIPPSSAEMAKARLSMSVTLYYHALEGTIIQEKRRLKNNNTDLTGLLKRDDFHKLLFACCVEIVLCSYKSPRMFPWILEALEIKPYYFYKVIELVVRAEENLSGQCVKHLNHIEEQILESLSWRSDSPLWEMLDNVEAPSCEEVNYPQHIDNVTEQSSLNVKSPIAHPRVKAVAEGDIGPRKTDGGSARDRFSSPAPGSAKRRLFAQNKTDTINVSPMRVEMVSTPTGKAIGVSVKSAEKERPRRVGSLALFFRKAYNLASVRLRHLCEQLAVSSELVPRIWTCFEYSISKWTKDLMMDRHIDQLLMCSVYIMAKITQHDQSFQEIMRCYRSQPQATSNVYRSVLIQRSISPTFIPSKPTLRSSGVVPDPTPSPAPERSPEKREDLIQFYNKVYVPKMRDFVKKFNPDCSQQLEVPLSPMPRPRLTPQSPRRVSAGHSIYVSPMKSRSLLLGVSPSRMEYHFHKSPAKHLRDINTAVQRHGPVLRMKRSLAFSGMAEQDEMAGAKRPALSRRLERVHAERNGAK